MKPLIFILGPTASGKSDLGLRLALAFRGAIFNCDSLQTYRRLDIGTAKPTSRERALVPHFLFDILGPGETLTAGDYRRAALEVMQRELQARPGFAVGGSGFYIQALEKGMFDLPKPHPENEMRVRADLEKYGAAEMFERLQSLDPETAEALSPNDTYRILRALIAIEDTGKKLSDLKRDFKPRKLPFPYIKLGLQPTREELLPEVVKRTEQMLADGLMSEVEGLVRDGYKDWPALQSVGYKECMDVLSGALVKEKLQAQIVEKTMQLAKKQKTWFKRDAEIQWLDTAKRFEQASDIVARFLDSQS